MVQTIELLHQLYSEKQTSINIKALLKNAIPVD
jgi:hypothetical protein